jgi:hypothetical protein
MANLETRLNKVEHLLKKKRKRISTAPKNNVFILPDDEKRYQAFVRYAKKHPHEREWLAIILPAKKEIS